MIVRGPWALPDDPPEDDDHLYAEMLEAWASPLDPLTACRVALDCLRYETRSQGCGRPRVRWVGGRESEISAAKIEIETLREALEAKR